MNEWNNELMIEMNEWLKWMNEWMIEMKKTNWNEWMK